jgi:hypothetical protein
MSHANPNVSKIKRRKRVERSEGGEGACVHEGNNAAGRLNEWRIRGDRQ